MSSCCVLLDFYNWNKVYVRYGYGGPFSGDAKGQAQVIFLNPDSMSPSSLSPSSLLVVMFY
jgi:hypothetical protein